MTSNAYHGPFSRHQGPLSRYNGPMFRCEEPLSEVGDSIWGKGRQKRGTRRARPPGRTSCKDYLAGVSGPAGTGGVVDAGEVVGVVGVVGVGAAALTFRPRNGCTPNSTIFSSREPKWFFTAVRSTSAIDFPSVRSF